MADTDNIIEELKRIDSADLFKSIRNETDPRVLKARSIREGIAPMKNPDGSISTHIMESSESDGRYYAYPTIFPNKEGILGPVDDSFAEAKKRRELFEFATDAEAKKFALGSWKPK